jgi:predicted component of type VI protein secretion system
VLGLATLMADRARTKGAYQLEGTTISASDNNPFKWSPTRRLAQDLLCGVDGAFLSDAQAVRASFQDISGHLTGVARGANAATDLVTATLSPEAIEQEAKTNGAFLRSHAAVCWDIHNRRHAALTTGDGGGAVLRVFGEAYRRAAEGADE